MNSSSPQPPAGGSRQMDYRQLDKVRSTAVPLQLDTIEAFAAGRLSRREFIKRATILGLSTGAIGMVIAACGSRRQQPIRRGHARPAAPARPRPPRAGSARGQCAGDDRWHDPGRHPEARHGRPGRDAGPRRLRHHRPVVRVPVHPRPRRPRHRSGPRARSGRRTRTGPSGPSTSARTSSGTTARRSPPMTSSRPWSASSRPATRASRASLAAGGAVATDANTVDLHAPRRATATSRISSRSSTPRR